MEDYILFDTPGEAKAADRRFLEQLGHRVMVCPGPPEGTMCPILKGEGCELAERARESFSSWIWTMTSTGQSSPGTKSRCEATCRSEWWFIPTRSTSTPTWSGGSKC